MSHLETDAAEVIAEINEEQIKERAFDTGRYAFTPVLCEGGGFTLGIACEGIQGYYPTNYHSVPTWNEAVEWANAINDRRLTRKEAAKIVLSSMRL